MSPTQFDPREAFPHFYDNPEIAMLGTQARWTVSGQIDLKDDKQQARKAPIDLVHLLEHGRVRGAWAPDEQCLVTLETLTRELPTAANAAFYIQSLSDEVIVLDIEPGCPPEIAADLLNLPGIRYAELSMSGRGYHLLMNPPANRYQHPVAAGKRVLRHPQGWYEILFDHWITFSRNPVPQHVIDQARSAAPGELTTVEAVYEHLAQNATSTTSGSSTDIDTDAVSASIPYGQEIVIRVVTSTRRQMPDQARFDHDLSRWEFSVLATAYWWLVPETRFYSHHDPDARYGDAEITWLLYLSALELLPWRDKHDGERNGRPYLLERAAALVADRLAGRDRSDD